MLRIEGIAGSPGVDRVLGHLRESRRKISGVAQAAFVLGVKGAGCSGESGRQVGGRVRARDLLRFNMGARATPRHEHAFSKRGTSIPCIDIPAVRE